MHHRQPSLRVRASSFSFTSITGQYSPEQGEIQLSGRVSENRIGGRHVGSTPAKKYSSSFRLPPSQHRKGTSLYYCCKQLVRSWTKRDSS